MELYEVIGVKYQYSERIRKCYRRIEACLKLKKNSVVGSAISQLYPLGNQGKLYEDHQIKKCSIALGILLAGVVSAAGLCLSSRTEERLTEGTGLIRNEWSAGDYSVTLQAENEKTGWQKEILLQVEARQLTDEEKETMFLELENNLPELIRGKNVDLLHVKYDLELPGEISGYPVRVSWSSNNRRIDGTGAVDLAGLGKEGEWAELTAELIYETEKKKVSYRVCLLPEPLSKEERFFRELEEVLKKRAKESSSEEIFLLPEEMNGQKIFWQEKTVDSSAVILLLAMAGAFAALKGVDSDLEKCCASRRKQLVEEYPDFLSRLRLYLSAGMTTKGAFYRLLEDYKRRLPKGNYLYEELHLACNRFQNGISEEQVYREWGKRCIEMQYRRLSLLLCSYLRLGNGQVLKELAEEEESAREEKRRYVRKLGEEATVKLLFPMLLQLLVVLGLILVPAYMDFGGI